MTRTPLRMLVRRDLKERKGIRWSRQHIGRKIKSGEFPPPDGRTSDSPNAPPWWFETTIDGYLKERARKAMAQRQQKQAAATAAAEAAT
jgi:hypothetical protein